MRPIWAWRKNFQGRVWAERSVLSDDTTSTANTSFVPTGCSHLVLERVPVAEWTSQVCQRAVRKIVGLSSIRFQGSGSVCGHNSCAPKCVCVCVMQPRGDTCKRSNAMLFTVLAQMIHIDVRHGGKRLSNSSADWFSATVCSAQSTNETSERKRKRPSRLLTQRCVDLSAELAEKLKVKQIPRRISLMRPSFFEEMQRMLIFKYTLIFHKRVGLMQHCRLFGRKKKKKTTRYALSGRKHFSQIKLSEAATH